MQLGCGVCRVVQVVGLWEQSCCAGSRDVIGLSSCGSWGHSGCGGSRIVGLIKVGYSFSAVSTSMDGWIDAKSLYLVQLAVKAVQ